MKRLVILIATLALLLLPIPALADPVPEHSGTGNCDIQHATGKIVIIVFDQFNYAGVYDDFCWTVPSYNITEYDYNFNIDGSFDDIGDEVDMGTAGVRSYSIHNYSDYGVCVGLYPDPNIGGIPLVYYLNGHTAVHNPQLLFPYIDTLDSLLVHREAACQSAAPGTGGTR